MQRLHNNSKMDSESSVLLSASFKPDTVLQSLVDLTSGATLLKAGRSVSYYNYSKIIVLMTVSG